MICHKIPHITFQRKPNYILLMILQISVQSGTRLLCGSVNLTTGYDRIMKHMMRIIPPAI